MQVPAGVDIGNSKGDGGGLGPRLLCYNPVLPG